MPILICLATAHAKTLESNRFTANVGPTRKFKSFGDGKTKCSLEDEGKQDLAEEFFSRPADSAGTALQTPSLLSEL